MKLLRIIFAAAVFYRIIFICAALAEFSFYPIDGFESGDASRWYRFGNAQVSISENPTEEVGDIIADSCGLYSLKLRGHAENWYVGGVGLNLGIDAMPFSRFQMDVYGSDTGGKIKIELFDDDNGNTSLEQDTERDWMPIKDDKWVAEIPVLGRGVTRYSIPFTAFKLENPGCGDGIWNPDQFAFSGGLLKIQVVVLSENQQGKVETKIDNLLLTY